MTERIDQLFTDTTEEGAQLGLLALMTGISEEYYCAGWMIGLEYACYAASKEGSIDYGMGVITERQAILLRLLSEEAGGWWIWPDDVNGGPIFTKDWKPE